MKAAVTFSLYVYNRDNKKHVATITGKIKHACVAAAGYHYGIIDYGWSDSMKGIKPSQVIENIKV
jgi:hypothetical protein